MGKRRRSSAERKAMFANMNNRKPIIQRKIFEGHPDSDNFQFSNNHPSKEVYVVHTPRKVSDFKIKREANPDKNKPFNNFIKEFAIGSIAIGASAVTANPIPIMLWKGYKTYNTIDTIVKIAKENNLDEKIKEIGTLMTGSIENHILEPKIENVSTKLADLFMPTNISELGTVLSAEPNLIHAMFESTIKNALETGWNNIPALVGGL